jgi:deoxyribonuclease-4
MAAMLPDDRPTTAIPLEDRRIGAHLPLGNGMVKAAARAAEIGATAAQIFGDNPTAWQRRASPPAEAPAFRARLADHEIEPLAVHASYLINLAGADSVFRAGSIDLLGAELAAAPGLGARFVNVHIGSHRGAGVEMGISRLADGVAAAFDRAAELLVGMPELPPAGSIDPILVLENSSGGGWGLGIDVDELARIATAIEDRGVPRGRVGFCLDTAHAWGAGHDLSDPGSIDEFVEEFDRRIGLGRLALIHLNDSKSELGSRMDRHEHVGAGRIGERGLGHLVRHPLLGGVAWIVETPGMEDGYDAINVARARSLARGEPLPTLPPEAFNLPGSRSRSSAAPPHADADVDPAAPEPVAPEPVAGR